VNTQNKQIHQAKRSRHFLARTILVLVSFAVIALLIILLVLAHEKSVTVPISVRKKVTSTKTVTVNECASNDLAKEIIVSISARRIWACQQNQVYLTTPVITGNKNLASDLTPTGTYRILKKQTNVSLIGCDTDKPTDCWNDFVHFDMIFLYNQYGHYDFHDATWRKPTDFGNIAPDSANASHGCVETPLQEMTELYNWTPLGTQIQINA